ncbi:hypothetical protein N480_22445 [Pseudoalteromonas luteoviolacea S2607]|uniref:hypothetical protein n=1 Tax=Pseudoalteromonas luteoviolacea TaxID=43657 RepID=UPI0007B038F6|nr:hypothetical protein [Pseudoalteromonas luteoviolacea]KZN34366.1 hypothetical protein N480_22445 [Pseudoalteromonas luteoviolacea S2607]
MKRASAYYRKGKIFLHSSSKTEQGVWILSEPAVVLDYNECVNELGEVLLDVLSKSKSGIRHPQNWSDLCSPVLKLTGVKSWRAFSKSAKCVEIDLIGENVELFPTINHGATEGFEAVDSLLIKKCASDCNDLGLALLEAIELSK